MGNYSMPRYFQNMPVVGKPVKVNAENVAELRAIEDDIHAHIAVSYTHLGAGQRRVYPPRPHSDPYLR